MNMKPASLFLACLAILVAPLASACSPPDADIHAVLPNRSSTVQVKGNATDLHPLEGPTLRLNTTAHWVRPCQVKGETGYILGHANFAKASFLGKGAFKVNQTEHGYAKTHDWKATVGVPRPTGSPCLPGMGPILKWELAHVEVCATPVLKATRLVPLTVLGETTCQGA